ncbi:MAG: hypothetical protein CL931_00020 [Deltaproteobacteria bacterium]|nr:hypothetical protein [Deltaproteobacteria bacterium]
MEIRGHTLLEDFSKVYILTFKDFITHTIDRHRTNKLKLGPPTLLNFSMGFEVRITNRSGCIPRVPRRQTLEVDRLTTVGTQTLMIN